MSESSAEYSDTQEVELIDPSVVKASMAEQEGETISVGRAKRPVNSDKIKELYKTESTIIAEDIETINNKFTPNTEQIRAATTQKKLEVTPELVTHKDEGPQVINISQNKASTEITVEEALSMIDENIELGDSLDNLSPELKINEKENPNNQIGNMKEIYKAATHHTIKLLKKLNVDPNNVNPEDIDANDEDFKKNYLISRNNILSAPRVTRVPMIVSGYFAEFSAYSHGDLMSVNRNTRTSNFVERKKLIFNSIHNHIVHTSIGDLDFQSWLKSTLLPDLDMIFFGIYDANFYGTNGYSLSCSKCNEGFVFEEDNERLGYMLNKDISKDMMEALLSSTKKQLVENSLYKRAKTIVRRILPETKILIEQSVPSLYDYLLTLEAIQGLDSQIRVASIEDENSDEFLSLRMYPYVSRLALPVVGKAEGDSSKIPVRYVYVTDRDEICTILHKLPRMDFESLYQGDEIVDIITLKGMEFYLKNISCTHCKTKLNPLRINMEQIFFFRLGEEMEKMRI